MLNPRERIDYGQELQAPPGFRLERALAATFSLDLDALTASTLALHLRQVLDDEAVEDRAVFLECVEALRSRLLVIHHPSAVKCSPRYNRVLGMLEPMLAPAKLARGREGAFSSFHPKFWLLSFREDEAAEPSRMRLVVLTRNISFDRSWDLAVSFDGIVGDTERRTNDELADFVRTIVPGEHREFASGLCDLLPRVEWSCPDGFSGLRFFPGLPKAVVPGGKVPFQLDDGADELLVMAPFVDAEQLAGLAANSRGRKTLVSRARTLDALGEEAIAGWRPMVLSDAIVSGEERLEQSGAKDQELHAKIIVARVGRRNVWHLGSANLTNAALGRGGGSPRNTELMVRLAADERRFSPGRLVQELENAGILVGHEFGEPPAPDPEREPDFRYAVHALSTEVRWMLRLEQHDGGCVTATLRAEPLPQLPRNIAVTIGLAGHAGQASLREELHWSGIPLCDLSAFVRIEVTHTASGCSKEFLVKAELSGRWHEARRDAITRALIGERKLLPYLAALLDPGMSRRRWREVDTPPSQVTRVFDDGLDGLYEQALRAAGRAPDLLARAIQVSNRLRRQGVQLPAQLDEFLALFEQHAH
jgi:hypothetical protein